MWFVICDLPGLHLLSFVNSFYQTHSRQQTPLHSRGGVDCLRPGVVSEVKLIQEKPSSYCFPIDKSQKTPFPAFWPDKHIFSFFNLLIFNSLHVTRWRLSIDINKRSIANTFKGRFIFCILSELGFIGFTDHRISTRQPICTFAYLHIRTFSYRLLHTYIVRCQIGSLFLKINLQLECIQWVIKDFFLDLSPLFLALG